MVSRGPAQSSRENTAEPTLGIIDRFITTSGDIMTQGLEAAPALVRATTLGNSIQVEPLTCAIGAELGNVSLAAAAQDDALMAEIRALLLRHRVLFFRDQDITCAEHVAFARCFGELEDHPVAGGDADREAPRAEGPVPRRRASGGAHASGDR